MNKLLRHTCRSAAAFMLLFGAMNTESALAAEVQSSERAVARRLTAEQYQSTIRYIFGPTIRTEGRFDAALRDYGLIEVGATSVSVSAAGLEQYDAMARSISEQVMQPGNRDALMACRPASDKAPDDACAGQFLGKAGLLLFRRPLSEPELARYVRAANHSARELKDFYSGLGLSLAGMLTAPQFLFRMETFERESDEDYRLDAYSRASRLAFFLWNTSPDQELLEAAAAGELNSNRGLRRQIDRMVASPRVEAGVRAFFSDMLHFDEFENLVKDAVIYPKFGFAVTEDAKEQTLRTIVDHLLVRREDYRDLFTTKKTFLTRALAAVYQVPFAPAGPNGSPDGWAPFKFDDNDQRGGILAQVSFVALHSHPGRSSPTLRGMALRETIMCQTVPAPPGDVNFSVVQDTSNPIHKTARARLKAHATEPACAGCHRIMDPIGLGLEIFDGGGSFRTTENGVKIDASGDLDGVEFTDAAGLGRAVSANSATTACVVNRLIAYGAGRAVSRQGMGWAMDVKKDFERRKFVFPELMKLIASRPEFYQYIPPLESNNAT